MIATIVITVLLALIGLMVGLILWEGRKKCTTTKDRN